MPGSDGSVVIKIDGDDSGFQKSLNELGGAAQKAGKIAMAAFAGTGATISAAATAAVAIGMNFESAMSNVAAISGATGDELAMLTDTAKELGAATQFSATDAANALSYMALAGWDAQQSVDALPGVLDLAAASGMELASASDMVTDYLSAFGMEAKDSTYFADMLAYAQSNANTTAAGLGEAYKNCASNMHAAGQDVETTTSLLSTLANQGLKGSEAGTALAAVMRDLTAKMDDGAIKIGNTSVAVMDASGNYRDMTDILRDVESATNGMGDAQKATALSSTFTSDSIRGLNMILNAGVDETAAFEQELRNSTGTASDMAATMNDNLKGRITELGSAAEGVAIQVYEAMEGPLKEGVEGAIDSVGELSDEMSDGKLKDSAEKIAQGFGKIVKGGAELTSKVLPSIVDGFSEVVDHGEQVVTVAGSVAAAYAGFKVTTNYIQPLAKGWKAATAALKAHEAASRLTLVAMNGGLPVTTTLVGVLTGKITLATAAQAAWNAVANLNPYVLAGSMLAAATIGIGLLTAAHLNAIDPIKETAKSIEEENKRLADLKQSSQDALSASTAEIDHAEALIYQFRQLTDATGRVKEGTDNYARAKELASQINAVAPGAIEDLQNEEGAYLKVADSIDLVIAKKRLQAKIEANENRYQDAIENYQKYIDTANTCADQVEDAERRMREAQNQNDAGKYTAAWKDREDAVKNYNGAINQATDAFSIMSEQESLTAALASNDINQITEAWAGAEGAVVKYTGTNASECESQLNSMQATNDRLHQMLEDGAEIPDYIIKQSDEALAKQKEQCRQANEANAQAVEDGKNKIASALGEQIQEIVSKAPDAATAQREINNAVINAVGELGTPLSLKASSVIVTAIAEMSAKASDAKTVGENIDNGLYDGLFKNLGMTAEQGRALMSAVLTAMEEEADINSPSRVTMEQGRYLDEGLGNGLTQNEGRATRPASTVMQNVLSTFTNGLSNLPVIGGMFASLFGGGITSGAGAANTAASNMSAGATNAARNGLVGLPGIGALAPSLFGSGITGNKGAASNAMSNVAAAAASAAGAQRGLFGASGSSDATAFTSGIQSGKGAADTASKTVAQSSAKTMDAQKSQYSKAGSTVAGQFKSGIGSTQNAIKSTSKTIAAAGHIAAAATRASWGTVGNNLAAGLASGIAGGKSSVINAAANLARRAIEAAKNALGIHSPSKVAEREVGQWYSKGVASGITKYAYVVQDAQNDLFDEMQAAVDSQIYHTSATLSNTAHSSSPASTGGKTVTIYYQPEQKCDEPITARRLNEINRQNARRMERIIKNA